MKMRIEQFYMMIYAYANTICDIIAKFISIL